MTINATIYRDESGVYCAEVPSLPGCFSDGDTFDEALANIREAAAGYLAAKDEAADVEYSGAVRVALWNTLRRNKWRLFWIFGLGGLSGFTAVIIFGRARMVHAQSLFRFIGAILHRVRNVR